MKDQLLIEKFISIFEDHISFVTKAELPKYGELYKKIICFGIIDTLSKTVLELKQHRKRITKFITTYSDHLIWNKVSSSHLMKLLELESFSEFDSLKTEVSKILNRIQTQSYCIVDLDYEDICYRWPKIQFVKHKINNKKIDLSDIKHINLFYNYRNYLIHELRRTDSTWDDDIEHTEPYYECLIDTRITPNNNCWEIGYPLGFFVKICNELIHNTKEYLNSKSINPYSIFERTDFLIKEFNQRWF
ncbi:MAG: hypothetical protein KAS53_11795 [Candidatus Cloacimonetes bacterium]|nr:hypothetical protein [Candidatus Cloacimonadota bacterium]